MRFTPTTLLVLCSMLLLAGPAFATTAVDASIIDLDSQAIAQNLMCDTFNVLRGDLGLIIGLILGFVGYLIIIQKEFHASGGILIAIGVCLTAFPDFFINSLNNIANMGSGIFSQTNIAITC